MNKKSIFTQTSITTDGKPVIAGVFKFFETHGLPLDIIFTLFQQENIVPDWIDFYLNALKSGMEHDRIISKLEESINDSFGKEWSDAVILRLNKTFKPQDSTND